MYFGRLPGMGVCVKQQPLEGLEPQSRDTDGVMVRSAGPVQAKLENTSDFKSP